jgi:sugar phosphate isomerase/epimerase
MEYLRMACQTITWGDGQNRKFPEIFSAVGDAGFQGVEIGWRHLQGTKPENLKRMLDATGLELAATHIGGNLKDTNQAKGEWAVLDGIIDCLHVTGTKLLMFSGLRYNNPEQFEQDLSLLVQVSSRCTEKGIRLLYHNHDWEFSEGHLIFKRLLREGISFCPDLGWICKGNGEIIPVLEQMKTRIGAIHFKDFASLEKKLDPVLLGTGIVPLKECAKWIRKNMDVPAWVIAEQDFSDLPAAEVAVANGEYLKKCFGECSK